VEQKRNVSIVGNIGRDPEVKQNSAGTVVEFSVAVSEGISKFNPDTGKSEVPARWYRVSAWDERLQALAKGLRQGDRVAVRGTHSIYESKGVKYDQVQAFAIATVNEWTFREASKKPAPPADELPF